MQIVGTIVGKVLVSLRGITKMAESKMVKFKMAEFKMTEIKMATIFKLIRLN